jgi:hypothetical protein
MKWFNFIMFDMYEKDFVDIGGSNSLLVWWLLWQLDISLKVDAWNLLSLG